jgi:chaperonin GroES
MNNTFLDSLQKIIVIGDKVLIKPREDSEKTTSGLFLPPGVQEKEKIQSGYVLKSGPGFAIGLNPEDEPWKEMKDEVKYIPLQVRRGDLALFLRKDAFELEYAQEKLYIVPHSAILLIVRDEIS